MINEEDHLRIQCLAAGLQLEDTWNLCNQIDNLLEETIDYAFDEKFGYLTCCPTNLGTGIRTSVMLHLPALTMTGYHTVLVDQSPSDVLRVVIPPPIRVCGHPYVNFLLRCGKARNVVTKLAAFLLTCQ